LANEAYMKVHGLDIQCNILGKTDKDIMSQRTASLNNTVDMSIINTGKPVLNKIIKLPFPHTGIKWCIMNKIPLRDNRLNIVGMTASFIDITKEREVGKREEILRSAVNQANAAIGVFSILDSGRMKSAYINNALLSIIGFSRKEFEHNPLCWLKNVVDSEKEYVQNYFKKVDLRENSISFGFTDRATGSRKNITIKSSGIKDENLLFQCWYDETEKISEEREKEQLLAELNLLSRFIDKTNSAVFIGEYIDYSNFIYRHIYKNKKSYEYIDDIMKWNSIIVPEHLDEALKMDNIIKHPKIMKYNIYNRKHKVVSVEVKNWEDNLNGKIYFFSVVKEIERIEKPEIIFSKNLDL
jgi:hypothetical protein